MLFQMKILELESTESISNFIQGNLWKKIIERFDDKIVIPWFLYIDDFELNNPFHAGINKIAGIYYSFPLLNESCIKKYFFRLFVKN